MNNKTIAIAVVAILLIAGASAFLLMKDDDEGSSRVMLDETLDVYGNANGDWTIDQKDTELIQKIIDDDTIDWENLYPSPTPTTMVRSTRKILTRPTR